MDCEWCGGDGGRRGELEAILAGPRPQMPRPLYRDHHRLRLGTADYHEGP